MVHLSPNGNSDGSYTSNTKICFGPVPSRRLGRSLGIDILPKKTCNLNCIYCELGECDGYCTEIGEYVSVEAIKEEIRRQINSGVPFDTLTFTASGEPTLHSKLGELIEYSRDLTDKPIAVLTNATLFSIPQVRKNVLRSHILLPSLDAASQEVFRKINRPHKSLNINDIIDGLLRLRDEYKGLMWLEILFVEGINDHDDEISRLKDACKMISPDKIQLNTVVRPPAVSWAKPLSFEKLQKIKMFFGEKAEVIIDEKRSAQELTTHLDASILLAALTRRPLRFYDMELMFNVKKDVLSETLNNLSRDGKVYSTLFHGEIFYFSKE